MICWISSTRGGKAISPVVRKSSMSRNNQGRPCAARPIMMASAPVTSSTCLAFCADVMSPLATTGMRAAAFTAAMVSYSASP